ncbi:MAG: hypothetical protein ISS74_06630 [Planctomycetes bacterium]|nr:hypothetical protein [Planctomycetota bacterium]
MKERALTRNLIIAGVVVAVAATAAVLWAAGGDGAAPPAPAAPVAPAQWEHLALQHEAARVIGDADLSQRIRGLGREGWELVGVTNCAKDGTTTQSIFFFKRPLRRPAD